ncbi:MAG: DNA-directed RNA polymerase subunit H [Candidatus Hadarchaeum sp.]|uniref:DNA-directed RNA polymerase subunit H n=1 Tax=Candidatus Hadarchaeum sp. TaxID=2883567 RepID=UPI003D0B415B
MPEEFQVGRHVLVPKHEVLSKDKVEELLQKYKISLYQLPLIKSSDPAVKEIGGKPGDVIKITRNSPTAGKAVAYRYVIEG